MGGIANEWSSAAAFLVVALPVLFFGPSVFADPPPTGKFTDDGRAPAPLGPSPEPQMAAPQNASSVAPPPGPPPSYVPAGPAPSYWQPAPPPQFAPAPPQPQPLPPPAPSAPPDWTLGAGVGFGTTDPTASTASTGSVYAIPVSTPSYAVSIERRVADRTWLMASGVLFYSHSDQLVTPQGTLASGGTATTPPPAPRQTLSLVTSRETILLGVRHVVARSVVDVSLYAAVAFAHAQYGGDDPHPGEQVSNYPGTATNLFALFGGFSVERMLIDALALRLNVDVAQVSYARQHVLASDSSSQNGLREAKLSTTSTALLLRPGIFLEFYF